MPAEIAFTHHAVERYIQRHAPELAYEVALARLQQATALKLRERTLLGQMQYEIQDPYCVLVVKRDRACTPDLICVTVLPARENSNGWSPEEEWIRNEWLADQAKLTGEGAAESFFRAGENIEREREKTRRLQPSDRLTMLIAKRCLRLVLVDLVRRSAEGDESARAIAELVQEVRPEFLQSDFLRIETEKEGTES